MTDCLWVQLCDEVYLAGRLGRRPLLGIGEDFGGQVRGDALEVGQGAAGGYAGVFEERGIEQEGAAVDEGMIGGAEGAAAAGMCRGAGEDALVHLQVGLKFQSGAGVPMLFAGEGGEEFLAKGGSVFAGHGFGFFVLRGGGTFGDQVECVGRHG